MIKIKKRLVLIFIILLSTNVLASLNINLKRDSYGPNQHLDGSINFSFSGELDADTLVIVSLNGISFEERLEDFLGVSATRASYSVSGKPVSKAVIEFKSAGSNTSYGIDLTQDGQIKPDVVNKLMFNISGSPLSGNEPSPMLPSIKFDDMLVWNYRGNIIEPKQYVNPGVPYLFSSKSNGVVSVKPREGFCQKTTIKAAPEYKIISSVKKIKEGYKLLAFIIDDIDSESIPSTCSSSSLCCEFNDIGSEFARRGCFIEKGLDFDNERYICVITGSGTGGAQNYYSIEKEVRNDKFAGYFIDDAGDVYPQENTDYFIWYEYAKFETNLSGKANLSDLSGIIDYPDKGNLIPITVSVKGKGKIELLELFSDVKEVDGPSSEYYKFTPISYTAPKVIYKGVKTNSLSSGFLDGLVTPIDEGVYKLTASIGSETKSKDINVVSQPFALIIWEPEFPGVNQEVIFNGSESFSPEDLKLLSYKWDFGDGKFGNGSVVRHSYNKTGDYNVGLTVKDENGIEGYDEIVMTVRSVIGDLGVALNATELNINSMKTYIENAEEHVKDSAEIIGIKKVLENATTEISLLKIRYNGTLAISNEAARETELGKISNDLYVLMQNIPSVFSVDSFKFEPKIINIQDIPLGSMNIQVSDEEAFKKGLLGYQEDISIKGDARLVYVVYASGDEESFILVKKNIDSSKALKGKIYEVSSDVKKVITSGYEAVVPNTVYSWPVTNKEIIYIIEGENINAAVNSKTFVLPPLTELGDIGGEIFEYGFECGNNVCDFGEDNVSCPEDCKKGYSLGFIIFLIILTLIGIYYINFYRGRFGFKTIGKDIKGLSEKKEELFKSEQDMINLRNYIKNSLAKGMTISQIVYSLKQKKWTDEQIKEAFKEAKIK